LKEAIDAVCQQGALGATHLCKKWQRHIINFGQISQKNKYMAVCEVVRWFQHKCHLI